MTQPYRIRSEETWSAAREAYLAGETIKSVCARFDLGERSFYARSGDEGWRRRDLPDPEPLPLDYALSADELDAVSDGDFQRLARRQMILAAQAGRAGEALRWGRLVDMVARQAEAPARAQREEVRAQREEVREQARAERRQARSSLDVLRDVNASARSLEQQAKTILATEKARAGLQDLQLLQSNSSNDAKTAPDAPPPNRAERRRMAKQAEKRR